MYDLLLEPTPIAATSTLQIQLFGSPQLFVDGQVLALPRRQMRALLYRLAASPQPVAREQLCFLLWPDILEATARRYLSVLLNQLRQVLLAPHMLQAQHDTILLDEALIEVDTALLSRAIRAASTERSIIQLSEAIHVYQGPFLHGFSLSASSEFDAWADQERQHWERRYLDALALLVDSYVAQKAYGQAIAAAQQALAVDELAEHMHRQLIALYGAIGDRAGALRQFERCVTVLERELGVAPLPETRAAYEAVRDGHLAVAKPLQTMRQTLLATLTEPIAPATRLVKLPAATTPLLGRTTEREYARATLLDPRVRLLTLCGPGGSGKTRLAQQVAWDVADSFADGAVFVPLASLRDPAFLQSEIASVCNLKQPSVEALHAWLRPKHMLFVLDNCEHLLEAAPDIAVLLEAAPHLHILATSRAALQLHGEHTFQVPPLPLPDLAHLPQPDELAAIPSVELLLVRTQALNARIKIYAENAADLAAICVRLDGLPLAIELAAARLKLLAPRDLLRRLDRRLAVLNNGPRDLPDRQQTLRATIDWSYRLLGFAEQVWFERYSVFVGEWTLAATEGLHERLGWPEQHTTDALDVLHALVDKSLIHVSTTTDSETRFSMLETIREFAVERLHDRGTSEAVAHAHAAYFLDLIEPWDRNAPEWLTNIERELDNLRAALRWSLTNPTHIDLALRLGNVLGRFWYWRDWITEGRWWQEQIVAHSASVRTEARARMLTSASLLATVQGETARAIELHEENLRLCRELHLLQPQSSALNALGTIYGRKGDYPRAINYLEAALEVARELDQPDTLGTALYMLGGVLIDEGRDVSRALSLYEECLAISREHGLAVIESMTLAALGLAHVLTGNIARGAELLPEALRLQREVNVTMAIGWTLQYHGVLTFYQADYIQAYQYFLESLDAVPQGGAHFIVPLSLEGIAGVASMQGQPERAAGLLGAAEALREAIDLHRSPIELPLYNSILTAVHTQLSPQTAREAWSVGRAFSLEQAMAKAKALFTP